MQTFRERMADESGFVHRRIIGAVGGFIRGGPLGAAAGFLSGGGRQQQPTVLTPVAQPRAAAVTCPPGFFFDGRSCVPRIAASGLRLNIGARGVPGRGVGGQDGAFPAPTTAQAELRTSLGRAVDPAAGVPVMGRFGAGFEPTVVDTETRMCGRGAVLGVDGICYNKRDLRNSERFWPRGRRPLLTGGEVRAISTAASAAKKLQRKQKELMKLGLLPKPTARRAPARLAPGHHAHIAHDGSEH